MLRLEINIEGKRFVDVQLALEEICLAVYQEYREGTDRNEDGKYVFKITGGEEELHPWYGHEDTESRRKMEMILYKYHQLSLADLGEITDARIVEFDLNVEKFWKLYNILVECFGQNKLISEIVEPMEPI